MLLTWLISDRDIFDKVAGYIKPEDFIDPLFSGVAEKVYEQYGTGNISRGLSLRPAIHGTWCQALRFSGRVRPR